MGESIKQTRVAPRTMQHLNMVVENQAPPVAPVLRELAPKANDIIVELGAGRGHFSLPIAGRLDALKGDGMVFAFDTSPTTVHRISQQARERGLNEHLQAACLNEVRPDRLPFEDDSVDSLLAVNTLQHLADPIPYLREMNRVLTPYGTLLIAEWQRASNRSHRGPVSPFGLLPEQMLRLLEEVGLGACLQIDLDGYAWAVRAVKSFVVLA